MDNDFLINSKLDVYKASSMTQDHQVRALAAKAALNTDDEDVMAHMMDLGPRGR